MLRAKVKVQDVSDKYDVWASWGSEREASWETPRNWRWAERSNIPEQLWEKDDTPWGNESLILRDRRGVGMGQRRLVSKGVRPPETKTHDTATEEDYTIHRIVRGVPEGSQEITPGVSFPMEANLEVMGGGAFSVFILRHESEDKPLTHEFSRLQKRLLHRSRAHRPDVSHWSDQKTHLSSRLTQLG